MKKAVLIIIFAISTLSAFSQTIEERLNLGLTNLKSGNFQEAIKHFDTIINLDKENIDAYNLRGYAKGQIEDYKGAIKDLNAVIKLEPGNSVAYDHRGICKKNLGEYNDALNDYNMAISINSQNASAYHNRAVVKYYFLVDTIEACYDWRSSANLGHKNGTNYFVQNCYSRNDIKTKYADNTDEIERRKQNYAQAMTEDEFKKYTKSLNIEYTIPNNFKKTEVVANSNMPYCFAIKHNEADFEIRFYIESYAKMQKQIDQKGGITDKGWFNKSIESFFVTALSNISQGVIPAYQHYQPDDVRNEFNADDGIYSNFFPDSEYSNNYKYCLLMMLHKNNHANIYVTFMGNDLEKFNKYLTAGFYTLKFAE